MFPLSDLDLIVSEPDWSHRTAGIGLCTDGFHSKYDGEAYENEKIHFPLKSKNS